jgi:hypothetical protein
MVKITGELKFTAGSTLFTWLVASQTIWFQIFQDWWTVACHDARPICQLLEVAVELYLSPPHWLL